MKKWKDEHIKGRRVIFKKEKMMKRKISKTLIMSLILTIALIVPVFAATKAKITLNKQGGSGGTGSVTATYGKAMPTVKVPAKTGYAFGGYYTKTKGAGTKYYTAAGKSAKKSTFKKATTLYAKWTANKYTVTLNRNYGSGGTGAVTATFGSNMPGITRPGRTGFTFAGYFTATSGGTQYYTAAGGSARAWNIAKATTLYARWTPNKYTVTLNNQGATTAGTTSVTATFASGMPTITVPKKTGYNFMGYYSEANGRGTRYYTASGTSSTNWNIASARTLYAYWAAQSRMVKYDTQGGKPTITSTMVAYGDPMPKVTPPTKENYIFSGFFTEPNGGGKRYYNEKGESASAFTQTADTTLYAYWISSGCNGKHPYNTRVTTKATLSSNGAMLRTCPLCKHTTTAIIPRIKSVGLNSYAVTYTGKGRTPAVVVKNAKGQLISKSNYTVKYTNNVRIGRAAKAEVTFKGAYSGKKVIGFKVVPKGTGIRKLKRQKRGFIVTWKRQTKHTSGYELQYSRYRNFKKGTRKLVLGDPKTYYGFRLTNLKKGKRYYVRIRTYKTVGGVDICSSWSKVKSVKTK